MTMNKLNLPPGTKFTAMLLLSFAISFMAFLFTPFDLYLHNPTVFLVGWKFLLPQLLFFTFIGFAALTTVFLLMWYRRIWLGIALLSLCALFVVYEHVVVGQFAETYVYLLSCIAVAMLLLVLLIKLLKEKAVDVAMVLTWGILIAAYIQLLFMNGSMYLFEEEGMDYSAFSLWNVINLTIWVAVAFLNVVLWIGFRVKKIEFKYEKALIFTAVLFFCMQTAGLVTTFLTTELPAGFEDNPSYLSYEPVLRLSGESNISVFLIDSLDVAYMAEALEKYPELYEQLDGFTFYKNNVSEFFYTIPSITTILTQRYYTDGLTLSEYWKDAWAQNSFIDTLKENGYATNLLIDRVTTYGNTEQIIDRASNIVLGGNIKASIKAMLKVIGRLSLGRLAPYFLKDFFMRAIEPSFGNALLMVDSPDGQDLIVWSMGDLKFYDYIKQSTISANSGKKVFSFAHLNGPHVSSRYYYDAEKDEMLQGGNSISVARACFEILNVYFKQMRLNGVYDNTTIFIISDHGQGISKRTANASLLIKPTDAKGKLRINTQTELSNKYFAASVLETAGLPHDNLGVSYFDIINGTPPPLRYAYEYKSIGSEKKTLSGYYEISGDANDLSNWRLVEK